MIYYACDICDTQNITDVNEVIVSIKVNGAWFGDKKTRQVCSNCLAVFNYAGFTSIGMSASFFKVVWKNLWK